MVIWESLSELEKANLLGGRFSTSKDWVVWCDSKKEREENRRLERHGKKLFSNYDEKKSKVEEKQEKKGKKVG